MNESQDLTLVVQIRTCRRYSYGTELRTNHVSVLRTGCGLNLVVRDKKVVGVAPWHRNPVR